MDINSILTAYDRVRQVIDESHFELVLDALRTHADNNEIDLVIEIIPEKREVWYKVCDHAFSRLFFSADANFKQYKLDRLLLNESTQNPTRIEITSKGIDIKHGAAFMTNQCDDPEDENVEQVNP